MLIAGYSKREIALFYGRSGDWVTERIRELREDIVEQVNASS